MAHHNTVFAQMLKLIPSHEFESLANQHHSGRRLRRMTRWTQSCLQQAGCGHGHRSIIRPPQPSRCGQQYGRPGAKTLSPGCLPAAGKRSWPLPMAKPMTSPRHALYSCPLPAAGSKGSIVVMDRGYTDWCGHRPAAVRRSIVVMDRGYTDYAWYNPLNNNDISFVTRLKTNAQYRVIERRTVLKTKGLTSDQTIELIGARAANCPIRLRRIGYQDADTGIQYTFLTNNFTLAAITIADIYKARWQVELFFKWIKQNLKIKSFLGASKHAVMTQIGIAMCVYLLLSYIKFLHKIQPSLQQMLRLLQLNLFERRDLLELLRSDLPEPLVPPNQITLLFS